MGAILSQGFRMLPHHGRFPYSPWTARARESWPFGRKLAVYLGVNLEHFAFGEGLGAELAPGGPQPDVLNYAWRDYGNRVGGFRLVQLLDELNLPATVLLNSAMYHHAPELVAAHRARGDEMAGHGRTNSERQSTLPEAEEARLIAESTAEIVKHEGKAPRGWLSPWIAESRVTPDLLVEAGYRYTLNWCMDDQPVWKTTRAGGVQRVHAGIAHADPPIRQRGVFRRRLLAAQRGAVLEALRQPRHLVPEADIAREVHALHRARRLGPRLRRGAGREAQQRGQQQRPHQTMLPSGQVRQWSWMPPAVVIQTSSRRAAMTASASRSARSR